MRSHSLHAGRLAALLGLLLGLVALALPTPSANAAGSSYQFWGYWTLKGQTWAFSQNGPSKTHPADGAVEGWRWAVAGTDSNRHPRGTVTFTQVCGNTPKADGKKRVAVVVDYGRKADATKGTPHKPVAKCASVATKATGADVLAAVTTVRQSNGMVCGIDDWPATGCGGEVKNPTAAQKAPDKTVQIAVAGNASTDAPASGQATAGSDSTTVAAAASDDANDSKSGQAIIGVVGIVVFILVIGGVLLALRRRRSVMED